MQSLLAVESKISKA